GVVEHPHRGRSQTFGLANSGVRVAVGNHNHLIGDIQLVQLAYQASEVVMDVTSLAVSGDYDGQFDRPLRLGGSCRCLLSDWSLDIHRLTWICGMAGAVAAIAGVWA